MSFRATALFGRHLVVLLLGLAAGPVMAQVANSPVVFVNQNAIVTSFVQTTNLGGGSGGSGDNSQWLKVEFHYSVTPAVGDYLPRSSSRFGWKASTCSRPTRRSRARALRWRSPVRSLTSMSSRARTVTALFMFIPRLSDATVPGGGYQDFDRKFNIHVEADVDGKAVDVFDKNKETDPNWYQPLRPIPGLLYLQNQSPFISADPDRYPALKLPASDK